ncbi:MAG: AI-2E family transporter [Desulfobulbaceae bacterium]|nr:AI-2E family transporter [Desulfobulbaceae bacterium]
MHKTEFAKLVLIGLGILSIVLFFVIILKSAVEMLLLIFAGVLFANFIRGISSFLFGRLLPLPENAGITITLILVFLSFIAFAILLAPQLAEQGENLIRQVPDAFEELRQKAGSLGWIRDSIQPLGGSEANGAAGKITTRARGLFATTFGAISSLFIILFVGLYLSFTPYYYINGLLQLIPSQGRERAKQIIQALGYTLGRWLIGRFIGMLAVSVFAFLGLLFLQVPLALSLATLAGILTFIPNIGPIIAAVPAILLGFTQSPVTALYVFLLYVIIETFESYLLTPLIQQREVALPPVLTLSSQVVLGSMLGLPGLILATPLTACALVLVKMLYLENVLGQDAEVDGTGS